MGRVVIAQPSACLYEGAALNRCSAISISCATSKIAALLGLRTVSGHFSSVRGLIGKYRCVMIAWLKIRRLN